jgi:hypothetical protein
MPRSTPDLLLDLTDTERFALRNLLAKTIETSRHPLSRRILTLKAILLKLVPHWRRVRARIRLMNLDLTDEETATLLRELDGLIDGDRYFMSPRIKTLKAIRAKIRLERAREPLPPPVNRGVTPPPRGSRKGYRAQLFRSHLSLAFAPATVCHCRFATASGPPQTSARIWSLM